MLFKRPSQEDTIWVFGVVGEWKTVPEASALIKSACRLKSRHGPCFETEASIGAPAGLANDMLEQRARHALPAMGKGRAHGLDFAMHRTEFLQRAAAKQFTIGPSRPEGNLRLAQGSEIEGMHTFGRRKLMHVLKVLAEECLDISTSEIIEANFHDRSNSGFCSRTTRSDAGAVEGHCTTKRRERPRSSAAAGYAAERREDVHRAGRTCWRIQSPTISCISGDMVSSIFSYSLGKPVLHR